MSARRNIFIVAIDKNSHTQNTTKNGKKIILFFVFLFRHLLYFIAHRPLANEKAVEGVVLLHDIRR